MRKRTLILLLLLPFAFGGVAYPQSPSAAAPSGGAPAAPFTGLDVTILIDQSASMWQSPRNDRYNHRIGQTKNLIYRLAEHVEGNAFVHRVSVIDFGDAASVALSNHVIRYNPADPGGALRDTKAVVERAVTDKPLRNTNTLDAMRLAAGEYAKMEASERRPGNRRVMLIITDGRPDVPGRSLAELKSGIEAQATALRSQQVGMWVVGVNDASNYWNEGDGDFWEKVTGGHARLAETASSKIFTIVQDIVDEWLGSKSTLFNGDEYQCPPYLRRIVFSVNTGLPRSAVGIVDPDGHDLPPSSGGPAVRPGTFTRFVVEDPQPGVYKLKRDPSRSYTPGVEAYSANLQRLSPAKATGLEAPARIVFRATTGKGTPLEMLSDYPINASIVITPPSGPPTEIKAEFQGDGKFASKWQPPQLGTYRVRLKGLVKLRTGADYDVFGANASSYDEALEVSNLHPYFLQLDSPDPVDGVRLMRPEAAADLAFAVVDAKGQRVTDLSGLVKEPATWLKLELIDQSGVPLAAPPLPLTPGAHGTFAHSLPARLDWVKGEGWWTPGRLSFRIVAQPDRMVSGNYFDSIHLPVDAEAQRVGGDPMALTLKLRFSWLILGPLLLLALGVVLGGGWLAGRRLLPHGFIWWADYRNGRSVTVKVYDADSDPDGFYGKKFPATSGHQFAYDRSLSVPVEGQDYIATKLRLKRALLVDRVEVDVLYSWQHEPKKSYTAKLRKGKIERLKGLPRADYAMSLEEKP